MTDFPCESINRYLDEKERDHLGLKEYREFLTQRLKHPTPGQQRQLATRKDRGKTLGALRTRWLADLDRDRTPVGVIPTYPLIAWSAARA